MRRNPPVARFTQPLYWLRPDGVHGWVPTGPPMIVGPVQNTLGWHSRATLYARLLVGLYVGHQPRWALDDVVKFIQNLGASGASFIAQEGLWEGLPEPSVQVVIFNAPPQQVPVTEFKRIMVALAETLANVFEQDEVIVEFSRSGRTYGVKR
jgi:hypothetical protein